MEQQTSIPIILAFAFGIRLAWVLVFYPEPISDFVFYFQSAVSIANGDGYVTGNGFPTAYFPIGYSLFLAGLFRLVGASVIVAQMANIVLSVLLLMAIYPSLPRSGISQSGFVVYDWLRS